jgi:hypothetical protein
MSHLPHIFCAPCLVPTVNMTQAIKLHNAMDQKPPYGKCSVGHPQLKLHHTGAGDKELHAALQARSWQQASMCH